MPAKGVYWKRTVNKTVTTSSPEPVNPRNRQWHVLTGLCHGDVTSILQVRMFSAINGVNQQLYSQGVRTDMQVLLYWLQQSQELATHNLNRIYVGKCGWHASTERLVQYTSNLWVLFWDQRSFQYSIPPFHSCMYTHTHTVGWVTCDDYHIAGSFRMAHILMQKQKLTISTSELNTALYQYFRTMEPTIVDLWYLLVLLHDRESTWMSCVSTKSKWSKWSRLALLFSAESTVKGYQANRAVGPMFLAKEWHVREKLSAGSIFLKISWRTWRAKGSDT